MNSLFGGKSYLHALKTFTLTLALILFAAAPICQAESYSSSSSGDLNKHARKVHHELTRFPAGSYVRLTLTDGSERTVALESVDDTSFTGTNAESNNRETHDYAEIAHVTREKNYVGEGSDRHVRHIRLWVPVVGALAAGAAATALLVR